MGLYYANQVGYKVNKKLAHITAPPPARAFVFVEESEADIDDCMYSFLPAGGQWLGRPVARHSSGAVFSFADNHVEFWKWREPGKWAGGGQSLPANVNSVDLKRVQQAGAIKQ